MNAQENVVEMSTEQMENAKGGIIWAMVIINAIYFVVGEPYATPAY
ncbi:MAG TPA: hypothetical protein VFV50_10285 [Bdellovibrionales bacterium]|nr:hypothetical protein [Bdellovibrionales bacterium]